MKTDIKLILSVVAVSISTLFVDAKESTLHFESSMESLQQYECPDWFRDAKFGIWSHWGPQSVPMRGDWYARYMYEQHTRFNKGKGIYKHHCDTYGHPSEFGFKDIIPLWKAEKFDPDALMKLYKAAGAKYFVSMGVHHDNFDLWDSKYHRWNAVDMGPRRDIVGEWQQAAQKYGLKFGVSEHLSASFSWWQSNHGSDTDGPKAGVPYDGANPENWDLYHTPTTSDSEGWVTENAQFAALWFARISDLLENYEPDLLYSDAALPFGEIGQTLLANYYNADLENNDGDLNAVYLSKPSRSGNGWNTFDGATCVENRERGGHAVVYPVPWQTDTSIGDWFYNTKWKNQDTGTMYRSPFWVLTTLVDVVSKNGNMLLNVLQRPDGSIDPEVVELLEALARWMDVNSVAIFETRPWTIFGEGPQKRKAEENDWKEDFVYSPQDIRYTSNKKDTKLYATAMGIPTEDIVLTEVAKSGRKVKKVRLLGSKDKILWEQSNEHLKIELPDLSNCEILPVFEITWK